MGYKVKVKYGDNYIISGLSAESETTKTLLTNGKLMNSNLELEIYNQDGSHSIVNNTDYCYYLGSTSTLSGGIGGVQYSWETGGTNTWTAYDNYLYIYLANGNGQAVAGVTTNSINLTSGTGAAVYGDLSTYSGGRVTNPASKSAGGSNGDANKIVYDDQPYTRVNLKGFKYGTIPNKSTLYLGAGIGGANGGTGGCKIYALVLYKTDDISGLSAYGSTISTIIANASSLFTDESAVEYMVLNCTGDFMGAAVADSTFLNALTNSSYYSLILTNDCGGKVLALTNY